MEANRRLLFWLRVPYAADGALVVLGVAMVVCDRTAGWWVLLFALIRAIIGTIALYVIAPRIIARRRAPGN